MNFVPDYTREWSKEEIKQIIKDNNVQFIKLSPCLIYQKQ